MGMCLASGDVSTQLKKKEYNKKRNGDARQYMHWKDCALLKRVHKFGYEMMKL
jgi:hypothetical protein